MDRSPEGCVAETWGLPSACGSVEGGAESDLDRLCRERRRALDDMRKLDEDLRREQAQHRFHRIRHGYR